MAESVAGIDRSEAAARWPAARRSAYRRASRGGRGPHRRAAVAGRPLRLPPRRAVLPAVRPAPGLGLRRPGAPRAGAGAAGRHDRAGQPGGAAYPVGVHRRCGGGPGRRDRPAVRRRPRAQTAAAVLAAASGIVLAGGHLLSTTSVDLLVWLAAALCVARMLRTGDTRWALGAGLALGVGLLNSRCPRCSAWAWSRVC
ncbi:glycosyltransferase family 39 protein [Micromonospora sp. BRA006-A]|nr:glycosyltransferase family 39 protein [Micromonospora sp. BRA006-A]